MQLSRRRLLGMAAAGGLLSGCEFSLRDGIFNECRAPMSQRLREFPVVKAAWRGLDPARVMDVHCHVFGKGDSPGGLWFNPDMESLAQPRKYLQRKFYMNAGCVHDIPGRLDTSVVERLLAQCDTMPSGFKALLFAFDRARDASGNAVRDRSTFYVPDAYPAALAAAHPHRFEWAASIHPYDPLALHRLEAASAAGARAIKWLPSAQGIDPAAVRCDRFYARLAQLRLPLITHAGDEGAVSGHDEDLGNPLRLRRPLDAGVRVVVAHCASLGQGRDLDAGGTAGVPNFELFSRLMDEPRHAGHLFGDISAVTQFNRVDVVATLLRRTEWHARLLNGSDYPLPGIVPLVNLTGLVARGLVQIADAVPLREIREHNALLFDFVLKRSIASDGAGFPASIFETRRFFTNPA